jgi:hypothetical protein
MPPHNGEATITTDPHLHTRCLKDNHVVIVGDVPLAPFELQVRLICLPPSQIEVLLLDVV